ncbi:MAG TPA: hypothetical protein VJB59_15690 [Bdellovibrionota bacterium]|nr:hypothetical protein [Bdellovibrionota bacterium]
MIRLFAAFLVICTPCIALSGGEVGNGGQQVALDFVTHGFTAVGLIEREFHAGSTSCKSGPYQDLCSLELERVRNAVRFAKVVSLPEVTQIEPGSGRALLYVALNFPQDQRILVSETEWRKPELCYVRKLPLALHEYLGLMGIEIQNYRFSSLFAEWLIKTTDKDKFQGCPELFSEGEWQ